MSKGKEPIQREETPVAKAERFFDDLSSLWKRRPKLCIILVLVWLTAVASPIGWWNSENKIEDLKEAITDAERRVDRTIQERDSAIQQRDAANMRLNLFQTRADQLFTNLPSAERLSALLEKIDGQSEQSNKILAASDTIQKRMDLLLSTRESQMLQRYPLGFAVFTVSGRRQVVPHEANHQLSYEFLWKDFQVEDAGDSLRVHLPDLRSFDGKKGILSTTIDFPKKPNKWRLLMVINEVAMYGETIEIDEDNFVLAIGFRPRAQ